MDNNNPFYHQYQTNLCDWGTDVWVKHIGWMRKLGVKSRDFTSHPCADDIVTLLLIRMELWDLMSQPERNCWGAYWGLVYVNHYPLNQKFWRKFQNITNQIDQRQIKKQVRQQIARQQIRNLKKHGS